MQKYIAVSIIGLGQIGGSLGLALKSKSLKGRYHITGIERKKDALNTALKIRAVDNASSSLQSAKNADIVVICTPVDTIASIYKELVKIVRQSAIITDTGSVKYQIEKEIIAFAKNRNYASFVGSHPVAGKEKNGILSADAKMFKDAKVIITTLSKKLEKKEMVVVRMWKDTGADVVAMSAKKHDELVALTSHVPHVIAFLLNKIYQKTNRKNPQIGMLTAGSFKGITRVAVSSVDMWAPIFVTNSKNVGRYLTELIGELVLFKKNLRDKQKIKKEILNTQK
jgi:prephenate dehydrogenase